MKLIFIVAAAAGGAGLASAAPFSSHEPDNPWLVLDRPAAEEPAETGDPESENILKALKTIYADENIEVSWGGRIMLDSTWYDADDAYPATGGSDPDGFEFRRARFYAKGKLWNIGFKAQYDFAGGEPEFKDVYMNYGTGIGKLQVGHFKEPMGLEQLTSSRYITFMERAMVIEALTPERNTGVMLSDTIDGTTNYAIFWGKDTDGFGDGTGDGEYSTTARLTHWFQTGEEGDGVHVGASGSYRTQSMVRYRTRPEVHITPDRVLDTGAMDMDGAVLFGAEAAWVRGPVSVQGEYVMASIDRFGGAGGEDTTLSGYYAFVSYFLTGEKRVYKPSGGDFDRVKPNKNFASPGGAWEVAARYSSLDFDDGAAIGESAGITLGVNWYLNPHTRIMLNYVHNNFDYSAGNLDEDLNALMMRFQVDW